MVEGPLRNDLGSPISAIDIGHNFDFSFTYARECNQSHVAAAVVVESTHLEGVPKFFASVWRIP